MQTLPRDRTDFEVSRIKLKEYNGVMEALSLVLPIVILYKEIIEHFSISNYRHYT